MNPLLDFSGLPRFDTVQPDHVAPAVRLLIGEYRELIAKLTGLDGKKVTTTVEARHVNLYPDENETPDRYHLGGMIRAVGMGRVLPFPAVRAHRGLAIDEVPIIAQVGERVLNRRQTADWNAGRGRSSVQIGDVHIHGNVDTPARARELADRTARQIMVELERRGRISGVA